MLEKKSEKDFWTHILLGGAGGSMEMINHLVKNSRNEDNVLTGISVIILLYELTFYVIR